MRKYFFGRLGFGLWPIVILVVFFSAAGGVDSMEEFAERALPIVLMGAAVGFVLWGLWALLQRRRNS